MNTLSVQFVNGTRYTERQVETSVSMSRLAELSDERDTAIAQVWLHDEAGNQLDRITGDDLEDMAAEADDYEDDGQPDEYTEWQDYMGGDDAYQYDNEY